MDLATLLAPYRGAVPARSIRRKNRTVQRVSALQWAIMRARTMRGAA